MTADQRDRPKPELDASISPFGDEAVPTIITHAEMQTKERIWEAPLTMIKLFARYFGDESSAFPNYADMKHMISKSANKQAPETFERIWQVDKKHRKMKYLILDCFNPKMAEYTHQQVTLDLLLQYAKLPRFDTHSAICFSELIRLYKVYDEKMHASLVCMHTELEEIVKMSPGALLKSSTLRRLLKRDPSSVEVSELENCYINLQTSADKFVKAWDERDSEVSDDTLRLHDHGRREDGIGVDQESTIATISTSELDPLDGDSTRTPLEHIKPPESSNNQDGSNLRQRHPYLSAQPENGVLQLDLELQALPPLPHSPVQDIDGGTHRVSQTPWNSVRPVLSTFSSKVVRALSLVWFIFRIPCLIFWILTLTVVLTSLVLGVQQGWSVAQYALEAGGLVVTPMWMRHLTCQCRCFEACVGAGSQADTQVLDGSTEEIDLS